MEYGVYLESSIVDLKPRVLDFLTVLVEKAKEAKDLAISFKKKEVAEVTGKDIRTTSRYLKELEERNIIQMKGVRGRSGGTVIMFNTDLIRFDTSDKALLNQDVSIEEVAELKLPKKQKPEEPKDNKRNRRTKQQMIEARALANEKQSELDRLHSKLEKLGGVPDWEWFKETNDPVGNYKTYLLTRLYNRYAVLFTDKHNATVDFMKEGNKVPTVSDDYDVLPYNFLGSSRWVQFEKFRHFCEENGIDPAVYLSAQFNTSVFISGVKQNKKMLPFTNTLIGEAAYTNYLNYCKRKARISPVYHFSHQVPAEFMDDFVVVAIRNTYDTADKETGLLYYKQEIRDFLEGFGSDEKDTALVAFYETLKDDLRKKNVSPESRDMIKKFFITQSLMLTGGERKLPRYVILGLETTRLLLASINDPTLTKEQTKEIKALALGKLVSPFSTVDQQKEIGSSCLYQLNTLHETPLVLRLIMQRRGLYLDLMKLQKAHKEYGVNKIPIDKYSVIDVDQIVDVMKNSIVEESEPEIDIKAVTDSRTWTLEGAIANANEIDNELEDFLKGLE